MADKKAVQVSAKTNQAITSAATPVFKALAGAKKMYDNAKAVAGIGDEAVEAGGAVGRQTKQLQDSQAASQSQPQKVQGSYKKGGKVKKTGVYRLHKKERVLNAKQTKKFESKGGLKALAGK